MARGKIPNPMERRHLLEKSMVQLALGNHDCALELLRRSREYLDPRTQDRNVAGYFGPLLAFFDHAVEERFVRAEHRSLLVQAARGDELLDQFEQYEAPLVEKWLDRSET